MRRSDLSCGQAKAKRWKRQGSGRASLITPGLARPSRHVSSNSQRTKHNERSPASWKTPRSFDTHREVSYPAPLFSLDTPPAALADKKNACRLVEACGEASRARPADPRSIDWCRLSIRSALSYFPSRICTGGGCSTESVNNYYRRLLVTCVS